MTGYGMAASEVHRQMMLLRRVRVGGTGNMAQDDVTAREASEITGLGERTIRRMIEDGRIPARKTAPNRYAIPRRALDQFRKHDRVGELERRIEALEAEVEHLQGVLEHKEHSTPPDTPKNDEMSPNALQRDSDSLPGLDMSPYRIGDATYTGGYRAWRTPAPPRPVAVARAMDGWPDTIRGRAAYISDRTGLKFGTVRDWRELREWSTVEEARIGLQLRGYAAVAGLL